MTVEPGQPCPTCGRESERAVWERQMGRLRARTQLQTSLIREPGLTTMEIIEAVAGTRSVADVLAARDRRVAASQEGQNQ